MDAQNLRSHDGPHDDRLRNAPHPALFEKAVDDARAAVDRSRNLRQAITFKRVLRTLQRRSAQEP
jgi:hypothetical protein